MPKHVLLVGAGSGMGLATARAAMAAGLRVTATARDPASLAALGVPVFPFEAEAPELAAEAVAEPLDGLVYFPGTIHLRPFARLTAEDFQRELQVNLLGAVAVIQAALPALKKAGSASVLLFSTVAVAQGMPFHASTAAAKGAVEGLARSLAAELAPGIRVNVIAPSLTDTPMAAALLNGEAKREAAAKRHPLQRVGQAEEVAELVMFLLGDASRSISGQIFRPDGGLSTLRIF